MSGVNPASPEFGANRAAMTEAIERLRAEQQKAVAGGGERYVARHRERGKLTVRERVELLVDTNSPFLELSSTAAWGTDFPVGASLVTGIGVIEGTVCMVIGHDPTQKGGATNPYSLRKGMRAAQIARENGLPVINLVESAGGDLPAQKDVFIPGGATFRDITTSSAARCPTIAVVFGNATAGGAYVPGLSDYVVMVKDRAKVFLGGPPLVQMATGEVTDDESLGGAEMHATVSGLADFMASDEHDALRLARMVVRNLNRTTSRTPGAVVAPAKDPQELLGIVTEDLRTPMDPRELITRFVDDSRFDEFKPLYGTTLVTGFARLMGYPVGILANAQGVLFSEAAMKGSQFIQLANQSDIPLLFLHNTTGYMVGASYERAGIIKHGSLMINAVANSRVPHLALVVGQSYGAGHYGMSGRAYNPRFMFSWPNARSAVMGPTQLAGVMSIIGRGAAERRGHDYDERADQEMRAQIEADIEHQSQALFTSGLGYDDGVIDPRHTRDVLGMCLHVVNTEPVEGVRGGYGVFRP